MRGYLAGYPVVDFRVTVTDGLVPRRRLERNGVPLWRPLAFRDGMTRARPTLLEPIMNVEVYAPVGLRRRPDGRPEQPPRPIAGMDTTRRATVIRATVPMAEMLTYEQTLTSTTGGRGAYHMEFSHYDEVPGICTARSSRPPRRSGARSKKRKSKGPRSKSKVQGPRACGQTAVVLSNERP
jgi:elongation factor G